MKYKLIPTKEIRPLEMVFPHHLKNLTEMIYRDKAIRFPLIVERDYNIVLDGSHRYIFLLQDGYELAPVLYVDYDDPNVRVGTSRLHRMLVKDKVMISKKEVIRRGVSGDLFPPRTTRHFFPFLRPEINVSLNKLRKTKEIDVSSFIVNVNIEEEIKHNRKYIEEIEEETDELIRYLEESRRTKKYLQNQIRRMEIEK